MVSKKIHKVHIISSPWKNGKIKTSMISNKLIHKTLIRYQLYWIFGFYCYCIMTDRKNWELELISLKSYCHWIWWKISHTFYSTYDWHYVPWHIVKYFYLDSKEWFFQYILINKQGKNITLFTFSTNINNSKILLKVILEVNGVSLILRILSKRKLKTAHHLLAGLNLLCSSHSEVV